MKFSLRHKSSGWLYPYIVPTGHLMLRGFLQKMYVNNREGVPTDKPVLLAANHPTAFIDPFLLCTHLDAPLYNMTRGDIFRKPLARNFLESINMFPVYRSRDGYNQRNRNDEVFDFCVAKLREDQVVTIYVEGEHHLEKRVRPIQKGVALIAFRALEEAGITELLIIPAGCNYVYGDQPRDTALVNIGQPIPVQAYAPAYRHDPKAAIAQLSADIESALRTVCFHIENPADDALAERLLELHRSDHPWQLLPIVEFKHPRFAAEKAVLDRLNDMPEPEKTALRTRVDAYFSALETAGTDDFSLCNAHQGHLAWALYFLLFFPAFMVGRISSWPVRATGRWAAGRFAKKREFKSSIWLGAGYVTGMFYYFLLAVVSLFTWNPRIIALAFALPALGWYGMHYREHFRRWWGMRRALALPNRNALLELRRGIIQPPLTSDTAVAATGVSSSTTNP
ncbi:MAG: 1-acyl-sn-glycerol-3-phosphate acyltransferase [Saprospiraceae bacterium]|nr:1-acyl-sn-glycerol-3-phosphate acyltransferase [Saprospiraceae bacterium]